MKEIIDPVYGNYVELDENEVKTIDKNFFQRLRRISQLGFSSITYPGATHTRFEHSLGVFYLTQLVCSQCCEDLSNEQKRDLKLAALLHDIGHGPFSHVSEIALEHKGVDHLEMSEKRIRENEDEIPGDIDRIIEYIRGDRMNVISGHIDVDRMDYLKRDSFKCGIDHGNIDINTLIKSFNIHDNEVVFDRRAISSIESLLIARSQMIRSVYVHHASLGAEIMVMESIRKYAEENGVEKTMNMDDYKAKEELLQMENYGSDLFRKVLNRDIIGVAFTLNEDEIPEDLKEPIYENKKKLEKEIAEESDLQDYEISINSVNTRYPENLSGSIKVIKENGNIENADQFSPLIGKINKDLNKDNIRIYSPKKKRNEVKENFKNLLNISN